MNPSTTDGRPIGEWLRQQPDSLRDLLDRARLLAEMNRALPSWTTDAWIKQVQIVNVRDGTLVIHAHSAAALVQLRYRKQSLLAWCNDRFGTDCQKLEAKVRSGS